MEFRGAVRHCDARPGHTRGGRNRSKYRAQVRRIGEPAIDQVLKGANETSQASSTRRIAMNAHCLKSDSPADGALQQVIEPLASYICAADRPRAALRSILKALLSEVQQTNQTALAYVGGHSGRC
jgi:hypothetical protein